MLFAIIQHPQLQRMNVRQIAAIGQIELVGPIFFVKLGWIVLLDQHARGEMPLQESGEFVQRRLAGRTER